MFAFADGVLGANIAVVRVCNVLSVMDFLDIPYYYSNLFPLSLYVMWRRSPGYELFFTWRDMAAAFSLVLKLAAVILFCELDVFKSAGSEFQAGAYCSECLVAVIFVALCGFEL